ncbi:NAD(P)/FAD-dependent oxidoreductase [Pedobacter sp. PWIIR3]
MADILIIGAGIVGLSSAYYLRKQGHQVVILDKSDIQDNCSFGNAGMIVPSHFVPLAAPGMIQQGIRWMFNSKSPFYVKPSLNKDLISWGLKFMKYANDDHVAHSAEPLRDLALLSKKLYQDLAKEPGFDFGLKNNGILAFYKTEKAGEEEAHLAEKGRALGLDMVVLSPQECKALQPEIELDVLGAVHYKCDSHLYPTKLMQALIRFLENDGVEIVRNHEVTEIDHVNGAINSVRAGGKVWKADQYVLATGSYSPALAQLAGIKLSIMPGKGYSFMEDNVEDKLQIPALLCEARVAITPMNDQIRYGGTMELAKINDQVNMKRVQGIVESVPKYMTNLRPALPQLSKIWYGFRPASPDGLPYIGRSKDFGNLLIATGHGMMGLGLGPATGLLISQLIDEDKTDVDVKAFLPSRFG